MSSAAAVLSIPPPPAKAIPSTFLASVKSWWNTGEKEGAVAEERLLRRISSFRAASDPDSTTDVNTRISKVQLLGSPSRYLNTLSMVPPQPVGDVPATVILHGYGAGLGFFTLNFPALSTWALKRSAPVYAVDWLGMGRSARVPFKVKSKLTDTAGRVRETEDFFVESLEEWRQQMRLEKMTLVGHSLGGYLSAIYALRYPQRVERLVLLSPAGVPASKDTSVPTEEFNETGSLPDGSSSSDLEPQAASPSRVKGIKKEQVQEKKKESWQRRMIVHAWESGVSPFGVLRGLSLWAPMLVGSYSSRRFPSLDEEHVRDLHEYLLNISLAKGSGEYAYSHLLAFGAEARQPLEHRIDRLKIPVTFMYGDHDWMDPEGGVRSVENLKKAGNDRSQTIIIPRAGHHLYLDNAPAVNHLLSKELDQAIIDYRLSRRSSV